MKRISEKYTKDIIEKLNKDNLLDIIYHTDYVSCIYPKIILKIFQDRIYITYITDDKPDIEFIKPSELDYINNILSE